MVNENSSLKNLNVLNAMFGIPSKAEFILEQFYGDLGSTNNFRTIFSLGLTYWQSLSDKEANDGMWLLSR